MVEFELVLDIQTILSWIRNNTPKILRGVRLAGYLEV
jgi:hypothetical protein